MPIQLPDGVKLHAVDGTVRVEGPKGKLERRVDRRVSIAVDGRTVQVRRPDDEPTTRGLHGLTRKLVANMVEGVSKGFSRTLEIAGVGYRAEAKGAALQLTLGYSHPIVYQLPATVTAKVDRQVVITLESPDRELLGQVAAQIRELRPPEPYKGKGIKYADERVRRKAGKSATGAR